MTVLAALLALSMGPRFAMGQGDVSPRWGRAVIVGVEGAAQAETPTGSIDLQEGMALSHGYAIKTDGSGNVCALLTPGALVCIHKDSRVELTDLQHVIQGLPQAGNPARGKIQLYLERGAILMHGMQSPDGVALSVNLGPGSVVEATRAEFIVARDRDGCHVFVEQGAVTVRDGDDARQVSEGQSATFGPRGGASAAPVEVADNLDGSKRYDFYVCRELFPTFSPLVADFTWEGLDGMAPVLSDGGALLWITRPSDALDVSPTTRVPGGGSMAASAPARPADGTGAERRRRTDMWAWYRGVGMLRGFNYLPRTAVNSIEMWQADTYDHDTIDEELGWAHDSGLNSVRVFIPFVVWQQDAAGLQSRLEDFLSLADKHDLQVVPVLFDDYNPHGLDPKAGPQPPPTPGVHNSQWVPSPGAARVRDTTTWPELERYVRGMVGSFRGDPRVLFWDLYSDPGRSGLGNASVPLASAVFDWARRERPSQPLTAGISSDLDAPSAAAIMRRSDLITFSAYQSRAELEANMALAGVEGRPVVCTGWLERTQALSFQNALPLFAHDHVGWYHWGLVAGKSQLHIPRSPSDGAVWPQALLKADGSPYDQDEVTLIRQFIFEEY